MFRPIATISRIFASGSESQNSAKSDASFSASYLYNQTCLEIFALDRISFDLPHIFGSTYCAV